MDKQKLINNILKMELNLYGTERGICELKILELSSESVLTKLAEYLETKLNELETISEGTQFIELNGDYKMLTVSGSINTKNGVRYTVLESNELFTKDYILNKLSKHDMLIAKLRRQEERNKQIELELKAEQEAELKAKEYYDFCYGYTNNKTSLQAGRILKALNKNVLYNGELITRKELIHNKLDSESRTELHVDKEGKKTNRFYISDGSFFEVTKIEFDYINYLIDNRVV